MSFIQDVCAKCGTEYSVLYEYRHGFWICRANACWDEEVERDSRRHVEQHQSVEDYRKLVAAHVETLTTRASHVEPHPMHTGFGWIVDMRPSAGRIFGANGVEVGTLSPPDIDRVVGFATRQAALEAEVAWLRAALEAGRLRSES